MEYYDQFSKSWRDQIDDFKCWRATTLLLQAISIFKHYNQSFFHIKQISEHKSNTVKVRDLNGFKLCINILGNLWVKYCRCYAFLARSTKWMSVSSSHNIKLNRCNNFSKWHKLFFKTAKFFGFHSDLDR